MTVRVARTVARRRHWWSTCRACGEREVWRTRGQAQRWAVCHWCAETPRPPRPTRPDPGISERRR